MTEQDESLESQEELEAAEVDANAPTEEEQQDHAPNEDDVPEEADAEAGADESEEEEASSEPADADDADEGDGDLDFHAWLRAGGLLINWGGGPRQYAVLGTYHDTPGR